jgi:hypothetical protein
MLPVDIIHLLAGDTIHCQQGILRMLAGDTTNMLAGDITNMLAGDTTDMQAEEFTTGNLRGQNGTFKHEILYSLKKKRTDASMSYYTLARTKRYSNTYRIHNTYAERAFLKMQAEDITHMLAQDIMHMNTQYTSCLLD